MNRSARSAAAAVMFCFLVSGMAGLVYQVAWERYLALFLGHASYSVMAVLVAFMGGLALGNAWFGSRADRAQKPLALYGWLEIGIAIYAILFPAYYSLCNSGFVSIARHLAPGSPLLLVLKFFFSFATILLPTTLMGATFPVLTRFVTRSLSELKQRVAALYFINSLGAVLGVLLADFWWLPELGLQMTVFGGAGLNLIAGLTALHFSRQIETGRASVATPAPAAKVESGEVYSPRELRLAIVGIGLSGFVAMLYEVAWTRTLALALGASTHAFALMLLTFISGIAAGAWFVSRSRWFKRSLEVFAWAELALAGTLLVSMFFYVDLPFWFLKGASLLSRRPEAYPIYEVLQTVICFAVMFVPAVCLGVTLPLVSRIATAELARTGRSVGRVFAVNTIGTVLGAIVTGWWLMPGIGLARTFALGISLNALIGLAILFRERWTRLRLIAAPLVAACFVFGAGIAFQEDWQQVFSLGLWRLPNPPATFQALRELVNNVKVVFHKDGAGSTVTVISVRDPVEKKDTLSLKVNGKTDASTDVDMTTQRLLGHLPMLMRPDSQQALVVGMGSGMTAAAVMRHPSIQHVDIAEISPEVVQASRVFANYNDRIWENPKVKIAVEDAKSFLKLGDQKYDVIISEPSNPWMAGVAAVFSSEYYEDCQSRLKPDGLMVQWVQTYETSDEIVDIVLRTFNSVFPYTSVWQTSSSDLVLVGSSRPRVTDLEALEKRFLEPAVKADLERIDIAAPSALLSLEVTSQQNGAFVPLEEGPIHSDFYPVLEFKAQQAFFVLGSANRWLRHDERLLPRPTTLLGEYLKKHTLTEADYKAVGRLYMECHLPGSEIFRSILLRWQREQPNSVWAMELMGQASGHVVTAELESLRIAPMEDLLIKYAEKDPDPLRQYESYLMQTYRTQRSAYYLPPADHLETVIRRLLETNPANRRVYNCHLAELAWDHGDDKACTEFGRAALDPDLARGGPSNFSIDPKAPRMALFRMIEILWRNGKLAEAWTFCQNVKDQGFIGDPMLDLMCRKIQAYLAQGR